MNVQADSIDRVIKNAVEVMDNSRYQIFEICESARSELDSLNKELEKVIEETKITIDRVDQLELDFRKARIRLSEVSRDFGRYQEQDIKQAYETATKIQMDILIYREKEINLKARRDDLQKRTRNVEKTIERAETVASQMNVVLEYLSGDLNQVTRILESAKNRQLLGLKIILAQEEERRRIAREIHDGMAQSMANLILRTEITERMMNKQDYEMAKVEIHDLKGQVRDNLEEVRKMIFNLRPMALDDLGLIPTLRKFVQDFEDKHKIRTQFDFHGKQARLPSAMEVALFRLVQESFSNVLKHAQATFVEVWITYQQDRVQVSVADNGVGFDPELVERKISEGDNFGLMGMKERVDLLEGTFKIESSKQTGTKIKIDVPLKVEEEAIKSENGKKGAGEE
ncbi:sensor histidine kinase [Marinicrinis sediminis]|uniref:Signal transduction histidine-protein kinase/phosphatase DegS n=1 Tax=Marinicrinis sediminis TaxID=1652465 RepID=A0ABW5RBJ9_9BACL